MMIPRGFVYVATGPGYLEEAAVSAASVRRHHPGTPICLVTDREIAPGGPFDHVVRRSDTVHKPVDKLLARHCPFERAIFLDTDTKVFGDLSPVFDLLEQFDLAALQDVNRGWHYAMPDVPLAFSEFNTGVIAFRRSAAIEQFFAAWRTHYDELHRTLGLVNDQPAFRRALYLSALRVAPLPSEFHFLGNVSNAIMWNVRLIHARGDYDAIARQVDAQLGNRAYIPGVGVLRPFHGRGQWLRATLRTLASMLRLGLRPPPDSAAANPRKWWNEESGPKPPPA